MLFPLDTNIRYGPRYRTSTLLPTGFSFAQDAVPCNRPPNAASVWALSQRNDRGDVSVYRVTHDEKTLNQGSSQTIGELFQARRHPKRGGIKRSLSAGSLPFVQGCAVDCPTQVDMATYKSEFLFHYYSKRLRPLSAYALDSSRGPGGRLKDSENGERTAAQSDHGALLKRLAGISNDVRSRHSLKRAFVTAPSRQSCAMKRDPASVLCPTRSLTFICRRGATRRFRFSNTPASVWRYLASGPVVAPALRLGDAKSRDLRGAQSPRCS